MQTYAELHRRHQGKSSDKWESYLPVYDHLFQPFQQLPVTVMEVGVQNGGSLEVLSKYFANARKIVGCDIDPRCGKLAYDDPRISVIVGNINTSEVYARVEAEVQPIDIFIDDGSHTSNDIIISFANYFPFVSPGGVYLIEDTHTLYWDVYGGGILRNQSAQNLFKCLTDIVNYEHWQGQVPLNTYLSPFFPANGMPEFVSQGWVQSVEFFNSMIVVHKAQAPTHAKLGQQLVVGTQFEVVRPAGPFQRPQ